MWRSWDSFFHYADSTGTKTEKPRLVIMVENAKPPQSLEGVIDGDLCENPNCITCPIGEQSLQLQYNMTLQEMYN